MLAKEFGQMVNDIDALAADHGDGYPILWPAAEALRAFHDGMTDTGLRAMLWLDLENLTPADGMVIPFCTIFGRTEPREFLRLEMTGKCESLRIIRNLNDRVMKIIEHVGENYKHVNHPFIFIYNTAIAWFLERGYSVVEFIDYGPLKFKATWAVDGDLIAVTFDYNPLLADYELMKKVPQE